MGNKREKDPIVQSVKKKYSYRSALGIKKYGITLAENNEPIWKRLNHLQEELMDATLYIEWAMQNLPQPMVLPSMSGLDADIVKPCVHANYRQCSHTGDKDFDDYMNGDW